MRISQDANTPLNVAEEVLGNGGGSGKRAVDRKKRSLGNNCEVESLKGTQPVSWVGRR